MSALSTAGIAGAASMVKPRRVRKVSGDEARGIVLAAQGLFDPPPAAPTLEDTHAMIEQLGAVQIDTITVVKQSQYLVLWSRLGAYDPTHLDALLHPHRRIFEYWSHAASIVPMSDYPYYRADMLRARDEHPWGSVSAWMRENPSTIAETLALVRERGPMASSDFERPVDGRRASAWDWYGPKDSRRALDVLWTMGDLMVHSRRGGQKIYDVRERVLAEAYGRRKMPRDERLPSPEEQLRHFAKRTVQALGIVTPSWLWNYFRLREYAFRAGLDGQNTHRRSTALTLLNELVERGKVVPATVEGLSEPAYIARERLADLKRIRAGERPERTTLLSPFDSLIWHRDRARTLFGYEVCFEAYIVPEKRRYGYYCLAILHRGRIVGRVDPKMDRANGALRIRTAYLEPGVVMDDALVSGLAGALWNLARFLGAKTIQVERSEPEALAPALRERVALTPA